MIRSTINLLQKNNFSNYQVCSYCVELLNIKDTEIILLLRNDEYCKMLQRAEKCFRDFSALTEKRVNSSCQIKSVPRHSRIQVDLFIQARVSYFRSI